MITIEQLKALKKGNVSVNTDKSKVRIPEAFKKATTAQKDEIINLSGLSKFTFYGAAKTGAASPRAVIALAQIMDISPFYLTGESDKKEPCDAAVLVEFFNKCSGDEKKPAKSKLPAKGKVTKAAPKPKVKPAKATKAPAAKPVKAVKKAAPVAVKPAKAKAAPVKAVKPKAVKTAVPAKTAPKAEKIIKIDDNSLIKLLEALAIRAKFGGEAEATYNKVVELLVK
jgi:hypothetical protein